MLALRGIFASIVAAGLVMVMGQSSALPKITRPVVMLRAGLEAIIAFTYITALKHLPLANATAIILASSLIIIAIAGIIGLERIGWRRICAILVGFLGVILVVQPKAEGSVAPIPFAAHSVAIAVSRHITLCALGQRLPSQRRAAAQFYQRRARLATTPNQETCKVPVLLCQNH